MENVWSVLSCSRFCMEHAKRMMISRQHASRKRRPKETAESLLEELAASNATSSDTSTDTKRLRRLVDSIASKALGELVFLSFFADCIWEFGSLTVDFDRLAEQSAYTFWWQHSQQGCWWVGLCWLRSWLALSWKSIASKAVGELVFVDWDLGSLLAERA